MAAAAVPAANDHLGPGRGAWSLGEPEDFGMSTALLEQAAQEIGERANERYCLVVAKDGVIVHETYYANTSATTYESDSLGKTVTAALVATAIEQGLVDLDRPLHEYGVTPQANWSASGTDYFPRVTLRHLLAQSSGYGVVPPGSKMTYDSNLYIQHISYALTAAIRRAATPRWEGARQFAAEEFAAALGIPDLYDYDETGIDMSAGGGQA